MAIARRIQKTRKNKSVASANIENVHLSEVSKPLSTEPSEQALVKEEVPTAKEERVVVGRLFVSVVSVHFC